MVDRAAVHAKALQDTGTIVAGIKPDQLALDTPCDGWDVRELLNHLIGGNFWVKPLVDGLTIEQVGDRLDGDQVGDAYVANYERSAAEAGASFGAEGALDKPVAVSYGPVPASMYCGHRFIDVLIHGWDLAVATGQDTTLDPDLVEACHAVIAPEMALLDASGMFGSNHEVPDGADRQTELLALLGRHA
jgi:uncharacterized protein (TIGR03086 family)